MMNPLVVAPLAIGAAGMAAQATSKISAASFGKLLSLGEKGTVAPASTDGDGDDSASALDSLFASSGQLSGDSVNELSATTDKLVKSIEAAIRQLLNDEGINPGAEFQLKINDNGEIEVDGAGTADDALSKLINGDSSLANMIRQAAANRSLLETAADHQDFSAAAGQDSPSSLDAYQALFGEKKQGQPQFTFRADEGLTLDLA